MKIIEKLKLNTTSLGLNTSYYKALDFSSVEFREIPEENKKNIILAMNHYDEVQTRFGKWEIENKRKKFSDQYYPVIEVQPPKDDVIEYSESW
jgi:hypothetical protein